MVVGDGAQIPLMAVVKAMFALGFMSPVSLTIIVGGMRFFYMVLEITTGYVALKIWRTTGCGATRLHFVLWVVTLQSDWLKKYYCVMPEILYACCVMPENIYDNAD